MKGKSIIMILGGIVIAIAAFALLKSGDIIYGVGTGLIAVALLFFGFKNKNKRPEYNINKNSIDNNFNISGSDRNDNNKH